jgi:CHAD domain-containing protein
VKAQLLGPFLARTIRKRLRRVLEDGPSAIERGRDADLHALRIAVKRLRYAVELTRTFSPEAAQTLKALARLQEALGSLADADAFRRTYATLGAEFGPGDPRRPGIEALHETTRAERERALGELRALWAGDETGNYPGRLAASISEMLGSLSVKGES